MFIQQPLVDLNVNNMAQSENNSLNAHNKARSKNEEEKQDQEGYHCLSHAFGLTMIKIKIETKSNLRVEAITT